jgi:hypothetical protein
MQSKKQLCCGKVLVKDAIADIALQQVLTRPEDFDVIATLNLERRLFERCISSSNWWNRNCTGRKLTM